MASKVMKKNNRTEESKRKVREKKEYKEGYLGSLIPNSRRASGMM